jgi:hypothetical protein
VILSSATVSEPESSMLAEMLPPWSALVTAALSASVRLANRIRCGEVATIDQASQPAAISPTRNRKGRLRFTAGWARISPDLPQRIGESRGERRRRLG